MSIGSDRRAPDAAHAVGIHVPFSRPMLSVRLLRGEARLVEHRAHAKGEKAGVEDGAKIVNVVGQSGLTRELRYQAAQLAIARQPNRRLHREQADDRRADWKAPCIRPRYLLDHADRPGAWRTGDTGSRDGRGGSEEEEKRHWTTRHAPGVSACRAACRLR
eukprot:371537-Prymnesium_polylepis.1